MAVKTGKDPILGAAADWAARSKPSDSPRSVFVVPPPAIRPAAAIPAADDADFVLLRVPRSSIHAVLAQESHHMNQKSTNPVSATTTAVAGSDTIGTIDAVALHADLAAELADLDAKRANVAAALHELNANGVGNVTRIAAAKGRSNTVKAVGKYSLAAAVGAGLTTAAYYGYKAWKATRG